MDFKDAGFKDTRMTCDVGVFFNVPCIYTWLG